MIERARCYLVLLFTIPVLCTPPSTPLLHVQTAPSTPLLRTATTAKAATKKGHPNPPIDIDLLVGDYGYLSSSSSFPSRINIITVRRSKRYPRNGANLDLSQNGQWFSAHRQSSDGDQPYTYIIFASAPSLYSRYLHEKITFHPMASSLDMLEYNFQRLPNNGHSMIPEPVPLCFDHQSQSQPQSQPQHQPHFLPGRWIDRPLSSLHNYGQSAVWLAWESAACYAEHAVHSCFFQNETDRAIVVGRRIWQPHACALIPFDSTLLLKKYANRHIYFQGDSTSVQMFVSLLCLLDGAEVSTKSLHWEDTSRQWNIKDNCKDGAFHCYFSGEAQAQCVDFLFSVRICVQDSIPYQQLPTNSILIASFGLHYYKSNENVFISQISDLIANAHLLSSRGIKILWRQVSLQHFDSIDCSYEQIIAALLGSSGSSSVSCSDRACDYTHSERYLRDSKGLQMIEESGAIDVLWIQGYENTSKSNVRIQKRSDTRVGDQDCTHLCVPGLPGKSFCCCCYAYLLHVY